LWNKGGVAEKVHRGQEGRVLKGLHPGGRCYSYRNVPIEDPTRPAKYGRPAVTGVSLEIDQEQASIVRRIFREYAEGFSLAAIAKRLNADEILSPQPSQAQRQRSWSVSSLYEILRRDRYRSVFVWNRTKKERNPETGRKVSRPRPSSEWQTVLVPEWRMVSDQLWEAVHRRAKLMRERFGSSGRSQIRSAAWSKYLFSGLLVCGECGARITIVAVSGKRAYPKYGCPNHRYRGTCNNRLLIRLDRLETQLLVGLEQRVLNPSAVVYVVGRLQDEIKAYCTNAARSNDISHLTGLEKEKIEIEDQAQRIVDAIAAAGHSAVLLQQLSDIEKRLAEVDRKINVSRPVMREPALCQIRDFVTRKLLNLRDFLRENVPRTPLAFNNLTLQSGPSFVTIL
jgi:site-specific DNA recombinase